MAEMAFSMPRFNAIGLAPAATVFTPSRKMAWARTVAVVVPSPATSLVLLATSRTIKAPVFSSGFLSSISLATVTPSLVMTGEPNFFSITTLRPFGPSVTFTASARVFTPRKITCRESSPVTTTFAAIRTSPGESINFFRSSRFGFGACLVQSSQHFIFPHDEILIAVKDDFGTRVFTKQDAVALFHIEWNRFAVLLELAFTSSKHLTFLRFIFGGIGNDETSLRCLLLLHTPHQNAIVQRHKINSHNSTPQHLRC